MASAQFKQCWYSEFINYAEGFAYLCLIPAMKVQSSSTDDRLSGYVRQPFNVFRCAFPLLSAERHRASWSEASPLLLSARGKNITVLIIIAHLLKPVSTTMKHQLIFPLLLAAVAAVPATLEASPNTCTPACGSKTAACCSGDAPFGGVIAFEVRSSSDVGFHLLTDIAVHLPEPWDGVLLFDFLCKFDLEEYFGKRLLWLWDLDCSEGNGMRGSIAIAMTSKKVRNIILSVIRRGVSSNLPASQTIGTNNWEKMKWPDLLKPAAKPEADFIISGRESRVIAKAVSL
ncbi:uncharacterized protein MYCFIDRAFT_175052 [Pseudocercospora fijiensis CIRAD86]|uniref:Uncharacterized protein n=1 Tax=Pseudocercospora fijiensis (strain CIRAD86) TaxID=383855 RepID=M2Z1B3_PSEFD|nr:uncharacterized protein MYCFIDRAFT_175052 [Pseudocercospora fijiensis CIRAD86]EME83625.1 hypothetical protein MYCFIDRAFT_175052 [Pseudocercospora fijiensis CIRAD86]